MLNCYVKSVTVSGLFSVFFCFLLFFPVSGIYIHDRRLIVNILNSLILPDRRVSMYLTVSLLFPAVLTFTPSLTEASFFLVAIFPSIFHLPYFYVSLTTPLSLSPFLTRTLSLSLARYLEHILIELFLTCRA